MAITLQRIVCNSNCCLNLEFAMHTLEHTSDSFNRWLYTAVSYALMGDQERAIEAGEKVLEYNPQFRISGYMMVDPVLDPVKLEKIISGFRIAEFQ